VHPNYLAAATRNIKEREKRRGEKVERKKTTATSEKKKKIAFQQQTSTNQSTSTNTPINQQQPHTHSLFLSSLFLHFLNTRHLSHFGSCFFFALFFDCLFDWIKMDSQ